MDGERTRGMPECASEEREHGRGRRNKKRVKGKGGGREGRIGKRDPRSEKRSAKSHEFMGDINSKLPRLSRAYHTILREAFADVGKPLRGRFAPRALSDEIGRDDFPLFVTGSTIVGHNSSRKERRIADDCAI